MKAVFLDRDGVINEYPGDFKYVTKWQEFRFLPGSKEAIKRLVDAGFAVFVISNQAGVSKGVYGQDALNLITKNMEAELNKQGIRLNRIYYCTHVPEDNCSCRKPKTGLITQAINEIKNQGKDLKISESYLIGDSIIDVQTGKSAGLKTILVFSGREKPGNKDNWPILPDWTADNLTQAAELIIYPHTNFCSRAGWTESEAATKSPVRINSNVDSKIGVGVKTIFVYASAGAGHRRAAEAVYSYYQDAAYSQDNRLIDILDYSNYAFKNIYIYGYLFLIKHAIWLWKFFFWLTSARSLRPLIARISLLFNHVNTFRFSKFLIREQPDVIISTHFLASEITAYLKRKQKINSYLVTIITDFGVHPFWLSQETDLYIAASAYTKDELMDNGIEECRIKSSGIPVDLKFSRQYSKIELRRRLGMCENKFTVLITTGSFGIGPIEKIVSAFYTDVQLIVISANNRRLYKRLKCRDYPGVRVFAFIENIEEAMAAAEIAVTKPGGLTISELLCMELVPVFISPIPGQETANIKILERYGIGCRIKNIKELREVMLDYKNNPQKINAAREIIRSIKKPFAAEDIYNALCESCSRSAG